MQVANHRAQDMRAKGWWGERTVFSQFESLLANNGEREALVDAINRADFLGSAPRRLTFLQVAEEVDRATVVLHQRGLGVGDVLCVQLPNCVEQFVIYLACARLGIVVSPLPIQYREHELLYIMELLQAKALMVYSGGPEQDAPVLRARELVDGGFLPANAVLALGSAPSLTEQENWSALLAQVQDATAQAQPLGEAAQITSEHVFTICWTSGTEARAKGVPHSHNEWFAQGRVSLGLSRVGQQDRILNPFPLINMAGFATCFFPWLLTGCTVVQHQPFKLPVYLQQLREEAISHTVAPAAILNAMLHKPELVQGIDFKLLSRIGSGAAPLSEWMVKEFQARWGVSILNFYGSNEGGSLAGSELDVPDPTLRATCFPRTGVAGLQWRGDGMDSVSTRLVDPANEEEITQPGRVGELRFSGPTVFSGYIGDPALTQRAFDDKGFYRSGDLFEIVGEGNAYYRYVGRLKDVIIRGGMNLSAEEIDSLLLAHPAIADAAVVGFPDEALGERVCAFVVLRDGIESLSLEQLSAFLRDEKKVAVFKLPERIEVVAALPRSAVGKILRRDLRDILNAEVAA